MGTLHRMAGGSSIRGWASAEARLAAKFLKDEVSSIDSEYPGRIEAMHQEVPITAENVFGPWRAPECLRIAKEACVRAWGSNQPPESTGCATTCPFDMSARDGPRCCGEHDAYGRPPLPTFSSIVDWANADQDLAKDGGGDVLLTNVVFRVKGTGPASDRSAILVSAHYDSVSGRNFKFAVGQDPALPTDHGPGLGDDLAGVAVLLEVARQLAASAPLPRDVIFAFVTGEEVGLMGSVVFRQLHEWRRRPSVVINLEGKGKANSKEWLVRASSPYAASAYARFASRPAGFSFAEWIFRTINVGYTDLEVYRRAGYHCMDLAYVHDAYVYHTPDDSLASVSAEGLAHEGANVLAVLRGVAADPGFPGPVAPEDDPVVGLWNNEFLSDPGMDSRSFYLALFDAYAWYMPAATARAVFIAASVACPAAALLLVRHMWASLRPAAAAAAAQPFAQVAAAAGTEAAVGAGAVLLGALGGVAADWAVVHKRDLRTWYDFQSTRMAFLCMSGALPLLALGVLRERRCAGSGPTDHASLLGALGTYALFLLLAGLGLPDLGFALFWAVLSIPAGLALEVALRALLPKSRPGHAAAQGDVACEYVLADSPRGDQGAGSLDPFSDICVLVARDVVAVLFPTVMQVPQVFNLVSVLSYIVDDGFGVANGAVFGLFAGLAALPFMPVVRRLSHQSMSLVLLFSVLAWASLLVRCLLVPTNRSWHCYFNLTC